MSAQVTTSANVLFQNTGAGLSPISIGFAPSIYQAGDAYQSGVQSIGTTEEAFELGDVSAAGLSCFLNIGADTVEIGVDDDGFIPSITLAPGEWCVAPFASAPWGKSLGAGSVKVQYAIIEQYSE